MSPKISAIVLNYHHPDDTTQCLRALLKTDLGKMVDYFIVDNSPDPKTEQAFKKQFPQITYLSSPRNLGFAAGNNLGIKKAMKAGAQYILIINPDVTVNHDFFVPLLKHFRGPAVGLVAPAIFHVQKSQKVIGLEGKVDWNLAKPEHRNLSSLADLQPIPAEFVTFACVLISRDTFQKVGFLDEGYFMYFEDVDYCLSAGRAGKKIILDPSVSVTHNTSSSFKNPTQKLFISFRSHLRFIRKWLTPGKRLIPFLYVCLLYPYLYLLWTYHGLKYKHV